MIQQQKEIKKGILLAVLIVGCFLSTLNQTLLNVALSSLKNAFHVDYYFMTFLTVIALILTLLLQKKTKSTH